MRILMLGLGLIVLASCHTPPKMPSGDESEAIDPNDKDRDSLLDADEELLGTDPHNPDTDGDGLLDGWEVRGVGNTQLAELGASPRRYDIFVEMDWMVRPDGLDLRPSDATLALIRGVFASAPVHNHDGSTGIALHLVWGKEVPYLSDMNKMAFYLKYKPKHFDVFDRGRSFHYMIWADGWGPAGDTTSGMSMGTPSSDFVVTLGRWNGGAGGDPFEQVGTFVHELGHNLGLHHGGADDIEEKPNHLSVMNYVWQTSGLRKNGTAGHFTYQWLKLGDVDENDLNESAGIGGNSTLAGFETTWYLPNGASTTGAALGPIDWDGKIASPPIKVDVNGRGGRTRLAGGIDEWSALHYRGGTIGSGVSFVELERAALTPPEGELPPEIREKRAKKMRERVGVRPGRFIVR